MIIYVVGRNFGHLSPCMAVIDAFQKIDREKIAIYAYKSTHRWLGKNISGDRVKIKTFTRAGMKNKKKKILARSRLIFHDWREEVAYLKQARSKDRPIIAGMFHSDLAITKQDNKKTRKFKRQVVEIADKTTDIFFHMNITPPRKKPNMKAKYVPIPIVARKPDMSVAKVKKKLGIPEHEPFILVQMGGGTGPYKYKYIEEWYKKLNALKLDYHIVITSPLKGDTKFPFKKHIRVAPVFSNGANLVNAAEMVISKPGRGIIYDCIALRKPLLLLPADTKERQVQNMMVKKLLKTNLCLAEKDMSSKKLEKRINQILKKKERFAEKFAKIPTNGAEIVAQSLALLKGKSVKDLDKQYKKILELTPFKV